MAFIYYERDLVSFYIKSSFSNRDEIVSEYIGRGDELALLNSIHRYMQKMAGRRLNEFMQQKLPCLISR